MNLAAIYMLIFALDTDYWLGIGDDSRHIYLGLLKIYFYFLEEKNCSGSKSKLNPT